MLEADDRPGKEMVLELVRQGRKTNSETFLRALRLECRIKACGFVSAKQDLDELKRHYALVHLKKYFTGSSRCLRSLAYSTFALINQLFYRDKGGWETSRPTG